MDTNLQRTYRQQRQRGMSARTAYALAQTETRHQELDWEATSGEYAIKRARLQREGFECVLTIQVDDDHDFTEFRGKFTSAWEHGALDNPDARYDRNVYKYFVPENSLEGYQAGYTQMGVCKADAYERARNDVYEDMMIALDPCSEGYAAYGVSAAVYAQGVELGEASVWGIEVVNTYNNDPYLEECALEELNEALSMAKEKLAKLQAWEGSVG